MDELTKFKEDQFISEVTYQMLLKLIKRKEEENIWKKYNHYYGLFMLFIVYPILLISLYILWKNAVIELSVTHVLRTFTNPIAWTIVLFVYIVHHVWFWMSKELEDYEDDCDDLRKEIIDRAEELWDEKTSWENRHRVYDFLDKHYDINLYHTS